MLIERFLGKCEDFLVDWQLLTWNKVLRSRCRIDWNHRLLDLTDLAGYSECLFEYFNLIWFWGL